MKLIRGTMRYYISVQNHELLEWLQLQTFYNGLQGSMKMLIDATIGGSLMSKTHQMTYELSEEMVANTYQWPIEYPIPKKIMGIHEADMFLHLQLKLQHCQSKLVP